MKLLQTWLSNYCDSYLVELSIFYLTFLKLFQPIYSGLSVFPFFFCLQNLHFSMTISPPKIRIFPFFLSVISTDKLVNRSKHAYALTQLSVFAFRGFFFHDIPKKQGRSLSKWGYKIQKICGGIMYSRTRTFRAEVHKYRILESQDGTASIKY